MKLNRRQRKELEKILWKVRSYLADMEEHALFGIGTSLLLHAGDAAAALGKTALGAPAEERRATRTRSPWASAMAALVCAAAGGAVTAGVLRRRRGRRLRNQQIVDTAGPAAEVGQTQEAGTATKPSDAEVGGSAG